jgi:predicted secreted protein
MDNNLKCSDKAEKAEKARIKKIVLSFNKYMRKYTKQKEYLYCSEDSVIKDVLYGLGISLNIEEYCFHDGFQKFKQRIKKMIKAEEPKKMIGANKNPFFPFRKNK